MNCFINLTTNTILEEEGLNELISLTCYGFPCIAIRETGEHLHNTINHPKHGRSIDIERDILDHDLLLKLQGKSN